MPMHDFDDDCLDFRPSCLLKTMKAFDATAKQPFETFEDYYPEYKRCCPGTVFVVFVILATISYVGLLGLLFFQSESILQVFYPVSISTGQEFQVSESLGVQIYPINGNGDPSLNGAGLFTIDNTWQSKVKIQWVECTVTDSSTPTCNDIGWQLCENGICPQTTKQLTLLDQLYSRNYKVIGFTIGHCDSANIPLNFSSSGYIAPSGTCSTTDAEVRSELNGAIVQVRGIPDLPANIENSFIENAVFQFRDLMDTSVLQIFEYFGTPFFLDRLIDVDAVNLGYELIKGPG
eukprot:675979-Amorphochlora_amoeboformis.AAC.1